MQINKYTEGAFVGRLATYAIVIYGAFLYYFCLGYSDWKKDALYLKTEAFQYYPILAFKALCAIAVVFAVYFLIRGDKNEK